MCEDSETKEHPTGWDLLRSLAGKEVKVVHGAGLLGVITLDTEELYVLKQDYCEGCLQSGDT